MTDTIDVAALGWQIADEQWLDTFAKKALAKRIDDALATALQSQADALAEARRMVALAEEAEEAAKDCFWAVYPTYIKAAGKGISTEAAHTELSARATTAEASLATMREALEPFAGKKMPSLRKTVRDYNEFGLRCMMSPMGIAMLRARRALGGSNAE